MSDRRRRRYAEDEEYRERQKANANRHLLKLAGALIVLALSATCFAQDLDPRHYLIPKMDNQVQVRPLVVVQPATIAISKTNLNLSWIASPDERVDGYNIYWQSEGGCADFVMPVGNVTNATVVNLDCGHLYHFKVVSRDLSGLESEFGFNQITNLADTSTNDLPVGVPLFFDLHFSDPGTTLQILTDFKQTWRDVSGITLTNGYCRVQGDREQAFYRVR